MIRDYNRGIEDKTIQKIERVWDKKQKKKTKKSTKAKSRAIRKLKELDGCRGLECVKKVDGLFK